MAKFIQDDGYYNQPSKSWKPGYIYVIDQGVGLTFKIGFTTKSPELRLKEIARNGSVIMPMQLLMSFDVDSNARQLEGLLHMRLDDHHIGGEWFKLDFRDLVGIYQVLSFFGAPKLYDRWYEFVPEDYQEYIDHYGIQPNFPYFTKKEAEMPFIFKGETDGN